MMMIFGSHWMSNTWYPALPTLPPPVLRDINGVQVSLGDTVAIVGVITQIIPVDLLDGYVVVNPLHPFPSLASLQVSSTACIKQ